MDAITLFISSLENPLATVLAQALDNAFIMTLITALLVSLFERRPEKLKKIFIAGLFAVLFSFALKSFVAIDRPCVYEPGKAACPSSYSFPSGHTILAFVVMLAFLNKPGFPVFLAFGLIVAFSRIYLSVHSFEDVAGSVALAPFAYYAGEMIYNIIASSKKPQTKPEASSGGSDLKRKLLHVLAGLGIIFILYHFGRTATMAALVLALVCGLLVINLLMLKVKVPLTAWFIENFERKGVRFPGYATAWYVAGLLMAATMLHLSSDIASVVCALALGDAAASIIGLRGKIRLPYNGAKTLEGTLAFFAVSCVSCLFIGPTGLVLAGALAIVESLPLGIDDNFTIPIAGAALLLII
jgi:phytol kinase